MVVPEQASPTKSYRPLSGISPSRHAPTPPPPGMAYGISPSRQAQASPGTASARADAQQAVWSELFSLVQHLDDTVETALQAFAPEGSGDSKVVSATTKRRLLIKSLAQLKQGKDGIQLLTEHLRALQAASQQWQRTMMYTSKSHEELMEQLENTNRDLHLTSERLRKVEAQRLAAVRETEAMKQQMQEVEVERKASQAAAKRRDEEFETLQFVQAEAQSELARLQQCANEAKVTAAEAEQARDRAVSSLDGVKAEAAKATSNAERHQETVAKLTADNLVFLMNLKKAEAELAVANQEKLQLRLAAEKQRGPWFDEVRASVEERVRQAMTRAEALELEMESLKQQHHLELQDVRGQKADLEEFLAQVRQHEADLEAGLQAARARQAAAEDEALSATTAASQLRAKVEALEAEGRVSQSNLKSMREECTERWVKEQAALGQFNQLHARINALEQAGAALQETGRQLKAQLEGQQAINRQLMSKKEDVEWQLMAALAKLEGSGGAVLPPPGSSPSRTLSLLQAQAQHEQQRVVLAPPVVPESPPPTSAHHTPRGSPTRSPATSVQLHTSTSPFQQPLQQHPPLQHLQQHQHLQQQQQQQQQHIAAIAQPPVPNLQPPAIRTSHPASPHQQQPVQHQVGGDSSSKGGGGDAMPLSHAQQAAASWKLHAAAAERQAHASTTPLTHHHHQQQHQHQQQQHHHHQQQQQQGSPHASHTKPDEGPVVTLLPPQLPEPKPRTPSSSQPPSPARSQSPSIHAYASVGEPLPLPPLPQEEQEQQQHPQQQQHMHHHHHHSNTRHGSEYSGIRYSGEHSRGLSAAEQNTTRTNTSSPPPHPTHATAPVAAGAAAAANDLRTADLRTSGMLPNNTAGTSGSRSGGSSMLHTSDMFHHPLGGVVPCETVGSSQLDHQPSISSAWVSAGSHHPKQVAEPLTLPPSMVPAPMPSSSLSPAAAAPTAPAAAAAAAAAANPLTAQGLGPLHPGMVQCIGWVSPPRETPAARTRESGSLLATPEADAQGKLEQQRTSDVVGQIFSGGQCRISAAAATTTPPRRS